MTTLSPSAVSPNSAMDLPSAVDPTPSIPSILSNPGTALSLTQTAAAERKTGGRVSRSGTTLRDRQPDIAASILTLSPSEARELILAGTLREPCRVTGYLYLSGCTGLTSLPEGLTVGGSLYLSGCTGLTHWGNKPFAWRVIDGYSMLIKSTKRRGDLLIHRAVWLRNIAPGKPMASCYVAEQGDYTAHGDTIEKAIRDLRFKIAQEDFDAEELAQTIRERGTVEWNDFRLITGACEAGLREGMREAGLDPEVNELPLDVVLAKARGSFGDAFRRALA